MDIINIAILAITGTVISLLIKQTRPELAFVLIFVCSIMIFSFGISKITSVIELIKNMNGYIDINEKYIGYIVRIIGISYVAEIASDLCKDAGHGAMASQVEIFGKISILAISMPVVTALIETITDMLG
ncbi:MAG: stage III sporulation protein AD [Lachnospiraceae bacterium]|nr:stage III sporulation protein AD [Lachnospiraceae bacterium]